MKRNPISPFLPPDLARALDLSESRGERFLPLEALSPRPQPRRRFEEASLEALADSIRAHGVLEPLHLPGHRLHLVGETEVGVT